MHPCLWSVLMLVWVNPAPSDEMRPKRYSSMIAADCTECSCSEGDGLAMGCGSSRLCRGERLLSLHVARVQHLHRMSNLTGLPHQHPGI